MRMREKGLKPSGCNCRIRAVNAYLKWSGSALGVPNLKGPPLILPTFTAEQIKRFIAFKPQRHYQRRLHCLCSSCLTRDRGPALRRGEN
jgi:hypothetical protein